MFMLRLIKNHWLDILIIAGVVLAIFQLYFRGHKEYLRDLAFKLVTDAELKYGSQTGELKYAFVHSKLPVMLSLIFSEKFVSELIEDAVDKLKDYLDDGLLNGSYPCKEE